VQCKGFTISPPDLPAYLQELAAGFTPPVEKKSISARELTEALTRAGGNKAKASRSLGISRPTLYRLLNLYNLSNI
jgi:transcriptional regulator of acetoin/glycerol metabolism